MAEVRAPERDRVEISNHDVSVEDRRRLSHVMPATDLNCSLTWERSWGQPIRDKLYQLCCAGALNQALFCGNCAVNVRVMAIMMGISLAHGNR